MQPPKLGILAGSGVLPGRLIAACREARREVFVVAFERMARAEDINAAAHAWAHVGEVDRTLAMLREAGVEEVVMAGPVERPGQRS